MHTLCLALLAHENSSGAYQIDVPGRCETRTTGNTCRRLAIKELRAPNTVWTIRGSYRGNIVIFQWVGVPKVLSCREAHVSICLCLFRRVSVPDRSAIFSFKVAFFMTSSTSKEGIRMIESERVMSSLVRTRQQGEEK